jgi:murein DD-endopeptidase MepM/ murein hydrolase activator NlpD
MSSKAEKTLDRSNKQPRLNIFFRSPLLLKIVAWIGSLSFLGSTGLVWAEFKPTETPQAQVPEIIQTAALPSGGAVKLEDREVYGPYLPVGQKPSPVQVNSTQLPNREVPVAVAPADAVILPTGTIVRPQHADILAADNYTVGVNKSTSSPKAAEEFTNAANPDQNRAIISVTRSQVQSGNSRPQSAIGQSVPTTSIQSKPKSEQTGAGHRAVPTVASLPSAPLHNRTGSSLPSTAVSMQPVGAQTTPRQYQPQYVPLAGLRQTIVAPMKPAVAPKTPAKVPAKLPAKAPSILTSAPATAEDSVTIVVPAPRSHKIVQAVAQLPVVNVKSVPTVPSIPSVRPAAMSASSQPIAFVNNGEPSVPLIYPLATPAPLTSSYGWRTHPITGSRRFHSGQDIGAPMGAPVVAAGSGIVMTSGWLGGYGKTIVIQHNGVQQTLYGHLSEIFVQPGQRIEQGTVIGRVGSTGNSTGPHLHFETKVATTDGWVAIDPGDEMRYALDNLRRSEPFAQRDLPPGYN